MRLSRMNVNRREFIREDSCGFVVEEFYLSNASNNCASTILAMVASGYTVA